MEQSPLFKLSTAYGRAVSRVTWNFNLSYRGQWTRHWNLVRAIYTHPTSRNICNFNKVLYLSLHYCFSHFVSLIQIFKYTLYSFPTVFFHKSNMISCPLLFALQTFPIIRCLCGVSQLCLLHKKLCSMRRVFLLTNTLLNTLWHLTLLNYYLLTFWTPAWSERDEMLQTEKEF
jgi:hypothetical protein